MKITELIDELKAILEKCGNKETYFYILDTDGELDNTLFEVKTETATVQENEIHIGIDLAYE